MKKKSFVVILFSVFLYITLSSDVDGPAHHGHGDVTGAPSGTTGHCQTSSCHGSNSSSLIAQLQVIDTTTMLPITQYHQGQTYLVKLTGDATSITTNLPTFGFQVSAVTGNHHLAGTYTIPSTSTGQLHTYPCGATTVVEHSTPLAQTTSGTNKYATQFYWTAPATFSDSVSFYSLLNAVNGDGGSSGDHPNAGPVVTIYEYASEGVKNLSTQQTDLSIYPNPMTTSITISASDKITNVAITNQVGQLVYHNQYNSAQVHIDINNLPKGIYFVKVNTGEVRTFVKQ